MSIFSNLPANATVRKCPFMSGAIFEYTGEDMDNLKKALDGIIKIFNSYTKDNITKITRDEIINIINETLREHNFKFCKCNDIYANQSLISLICNFSKEIHYELKYNDAYKHYYRCICNNTIMSPKKLTQGVLKLKKFLINENKYFCMCANLNTFGLGNYVKCYNNNLEYLISENRNKVIITSIHNPYLINKLLDFSNSDEYYIDSNQ